MRKQIYQKGVQSILQWYPTEKQWWVTGFNPQHLREEVDVHKQVMIGNVTFKSENMYNAFANKFNRSNKISDYFTYDKDNKTVWIMWYGEGMI